MKNYQYFVKFYKEIKEEFKRKGLDVVDIHRKIPKKAYYDKIGIKDKEKIKLMEHRKTKEMNDRISLGLENAKLFEIEEKIKRLLLLTDMPSDKEFLKKIRLPFKTIFIETEITNNDIDLGVDKIYGLLISEVPIVAEEKKKNIGYGFIVHYLCEDKGKYYVDEFKIAFVKELDIWYDDKKTLKMLKSFIINLILFIENPEVEVIERKRGEKNKERRIRKGKMPLPDSNIIRLIGKLKIYIDRFGESLGGSYNYRFWCRGHFRHFRNPKFKNVVGKVIWIAPFIKGEGILIDKTYKLDKTKKDKRVKKIEEENLFYDDIKPLEKPLREEKIKEGYKPPLKYKRK